MGVSYESERGWKRRIAGEIAESLDTQLDPADDLLEETATNLIEEHYDSGDLEEGMRDRLLATLGEITDIAREKILQAMEEILPAEEDADSDAFDEE